MRHSPALSQASREEGWDFNPKHGSCLTDAHLSISNSRGLGDWGSETAMGRRPGSASTLVLHHSVMHSQQKRWPQGVAVECLRSSKHRVQSGVLHTALSSRELLRWDRLRCSRHSFLARCFCLKLYNRSPMDSTRCKREISPSSP